MSVNNFSFGIIINNFKNKKSYNMTAKIGLSGFVKED